MKKFLTLGLVATVLAGFFVVAVQQPSEAHHNWQQGYGGYGNQLGSNQFMNTAASRYPLNNGMASAFGNQSLTSGLLGNNRNAEKRAMKQQRRLMKEEQMAASGIPLGSNGYNSGYNSGLLSNVSNPLGLGGGLGGLGGGLGGLGGGLGGLGSGGFGGGCGNHSTAAAYAQGYRAGVSSAAGSGYGSYGNGLTGSNGLSGLNGISGMNGLNGRNGLYGMHRHNGLNGLTGMNRLNGLSYGNGSGVSSVLGRVLRRI